MAFQLRLEIKLLSKKHCNLYNWRCEYSNEYSRIRTIAIQLPVKIILLNNNWQGMLGNGNNHFMVNVIHTQV